MKPMIVPRRPSFISVSLAKAPKPFEPRSLSASDRSSRVWSSLPPPLRPRLQREIANMVAHEARRQVLETSVRQIRADHDLRGGAPARVSLAGDDDGAPQTMQRSANIKNADRRTDMRAIGLEHELKKTVAPKQRGGEYRDAGEDKPVEQGSPLGARRRRRPVWGKSDRGHDKAVLPSGLCDASGDRCLSAKDSCGARSSASGLALTACEGPRDRLRHRLLEIRVDLVEEALGREPLLLGADK